MSSTSIEQDDLLSKLAMCIPPGGPPEFHQVPRAVAEELSRRTEAWKVYFQRALVAEKGVAFLHRLAMEGGSIVSSAALPPELVKLAHEEGRMFVAMDNLGYVFLPGGTTP